MLELRRLLKDDRLIRAITGISGKEFRQLLPDFTKEFQRADKKSRKHPTKGVKHTLENDEARLIFTLFYIKCYPTFDLAGVMYGVDRAQPCRWAATLTEVLEKAMKRKLVLPARKIKDLKELIELIPEIKEVLVDGTERPIQRPKNPKKQKEKYSGKKKRHSVKNLVVSDIEKRILFLSPTISGKTHDYSHFKDIHLERGFPDGANIWLDNGFQGIEKDFPDLKVYMPQRKPRGKPLSKERKALNRGISGIRVLVEHAIGGIKRLRSLTDVYRNKRQDFEDRLMSLGAGIWNLHLTKT